MNNRVCLRKMFEIEDFFLVFAEYLDEIFPDDWTEYFYDAGIAVRVSSTMGWAECLKRTCDKFGLNDCWDYYDSLDWERSDMFDAEIENLLVLIVFDAEDNRIKR